MKLIKPHQEIDKRCLAGSRRSDNRNQLTGLYVKTEVFDKRNVFFIGKADVFHFHTALGLFDGRSDGVGHLFFLVNKGENPFRRRKRGLKLIDDVAHIDKRLHKQLRVEHENGDCSDIIASVDDQIPADDADEHIA